MPGGNFCSLSKEDLVLHRPPPPLPFLKPREGVGGVGRVEERDATHSFFSPLLFREGEKGRGG